MTRPIDLSGKTFGQLLVISRTENSPAGKARWLCKCSCGSTKIIIGSKLINGETVSCGCYRRTSSALLHTTHGKSGTPEYNSWINMIARCNNPSRPDYIHYGGRGISVCKEWESFEGFWEDMAAGYFSGATLERKDNAGNYCKENCRWATRVEQARNRRKLRTNKTGVNGVNLYDYGGRRYYCATWTDPAGVSRRKYFSTVELGEDEAFRLACEHRKNMLAVLNQQGANYSTTHGL